MDKNIMTIAQELGIRPQQVEATTALLDEGATVPFISRYRKEVTGSLDEVAVAAIRDRIAQLRELDKRRETVLRSIEEQGKLTDALKEKIEQAATMAQLEDLYLPYKPKRRTRAQIAREKGLEPLALRLFEQQERFDPAEAAAQFVDAEKEVADVEAALAGARDIIAELVNEEQETRAEMRTLFEKQGTFRATLIPGKEEEGAKYKDYFEWSEPIAAAPSHRVLAMRRAEREMVISLDCTPDDELALAALSSRHVRAGGAVGEQIALAVKDAYRRLLKPSMETEIRLLSKKRADEEAIRVFAENLRQLLLGAPLGQKNLLAIDPGIRTGCKLVALDRQGKLLDNTVIFPDRKRGEAEAIVLAFCHKYDTEAIAIGNGTAGRETEAFVRAIAPKHIAVVMVNESGASVYSASDVAREEFPDHDLTVRGAVSIGRRLMDPLAELVKIDPKSIGVGQYQHDVDQLALKHSLDDTVVSCVNAVGVEVNTASKELLTYVSGLNGTIAKNIVEYRNTNGPFRSREELKKVGRLGPKAFEQCAGFLRIREGENVLDGSAVHPERYALVSRMAQDLGCSVADLIEKEELRARIDLKKYVSETVGMPTLNDIMRELSKPGRDPREAFEVFSFTEGVEKPSDLKVGMVLPGIVTNITAFGAFVDVGVHQDGLVHVSEMSDRYITDPNEVVKVQQKVNVTVLEVDLQRNRIALSMRSGAGPKKKGGDRGADRGTDRGQGRKREQAPEPSDNLSMDEKLRMLQSKFKR